MLYPHLSQILWQELHDPMSFAEGESEGNLRQRRQQLAAVQQRLENFIHQWGLNTGPGPIATTIYLDRELRIFSTCADSASLFLKIGTLFPGSISQHDLVVENAGVLFNNPCDAHATPTLQNTVRDVAARLHPVSPELFYEQFHGSDFKHNKAVDKSQRMMVVVRGEIESLTQQFIDLLSEARQQHPELFNQLDGFDLTYLESALSPKFCKRVALEVADALNLPTHSSKPAVCVHSFTENEIPAVFAMYARSWVAVVSEPAMAIDSLNADTPCFWIGPAVPKTSHTSCVQQSLPMLSRAPMTSSCLNCIDMRRDLIKKQRIVLLAQALPMTARTNVHSHFRSLATYLCDTMAAQHLVGPELLQKMLYQLATQPHGAFWPTTQNRTRSIRYRMHAHKRRVRNKWKKLRYSPRQFVRDSGVFKRALSNRPS